MTAGRDGKFKIWVLAEQGTSMYNLLVMDNRVSGWVGFNEWLKIGELRSYNVHEELQTLLIAENWMCKVTRNSTLTEIIKNWIIIIG